MSHSLKIDNDLVERSDTTGPRYTSYPTTVHFSDNFGDADYRGFALQSNEDLIRRGIELTYDDTLRAEIINRLICYGEIDTSLIEQRYGVRFEHYFEDELGQLDIMSRDGLVGTRGRKIRLTPTGQLLVRNVCMIFDRHPHRHEKKKGFSRVI
ncbi:MAG: hypothetical protein OEU36_19775 [Gammaproteobacteria bacterium]|nr:hypothetical protein [Gammaproteobacteria bacterium]